MDLSPARDQRRARAAPLNVGRTPCEHALARVLGYLRLSGVALTRETTLGALRLVEEVLAEGEARIDEADALIAGVMMRLPGRFALPEPELPEAFPPLMRGSIGYDAYP